MKRIDILSILILLVTDEEISRPMATGRRDRDLLSVSTSRRLRSSDRDGVRQ